MTDFSVFAVFLLNPNPILALWLILGLIFNVICLWDEPQRAFPRPVPRPNLDLVIIFEKLLLLFLDSGAQLPPKME